MPYRYAGAECVGSLAFPTLIKKHQSLLPGGELMSTVDPELGTPQSAKAQAEPSVRCLRKNYFSTAIFKCDHEDGEHLNKALLDLAYAEREQGIAGRKSNAA